MPDMEPFGCPNEAFFLRFAKLEHGIQSHQDFLLLFRHPGPDRPWRQARVEIRHYCGCHTWGGSWTGCSLSLWRHRSFGGTHFAGTQLAPLERTAEWSADAFAANLGILVRNSCFLG